MSALAGRLAVVTGASRGIGAAVAAALAAAGATVARLARSLDDAREGPFLDCRCDVADPLAVQTAGARVRREAGVPDILVSNAGAFLLKPFEDTTPDEFRTQLDVNLAGVFLVARTFLPAMREAGRGDYVTIGSIADHEALPGNAAYAASKWGARGLHATLAAELEGSGIRCTLLSPGATDTPLWAPLDPDARADLPDRTAMLQPDDVAEAVHWVVTRPARVRIPLLRIMPR